MSLRRITLLCKHTDYFDRKGDYEMFIGLMSVSKECSRGRKVLESMKAEKFSVDGIIQRNGILKNYSLFRFS